MKKTYKELKEVDFMVGLMYQDNPELKKTKFSYAFDKFFRKNYLPLFTELQEKLSDLRLDSALTDKITNEILFDKDSFRGYKYDKQELKKLINLERQMIEEYDKKEIEIEPYMSSYIPEDITELQKELLTGLII